MKKYILTLILIPLFFGCSNTNIIENGVFKKWEKCKVGSGCIIDIAEITNFQWDTMCFYSGSYSLDEINRDLGFKLKEYTDIGDRLIFLNKGKLVYQEEWFTNPSEHSKEVVFNDKRRKFRLSKCHVKFRIKRRHRIYTLIGI
ncbi:MAG: hypothetical protein ACEPOV_10315 [Hyphomicrobiales bacterium]